MNASTWLFGRPWDLHPDKLREICYAFSDREKGIRLDEATLAELKEQNERERNRRRFDVSDGIATIPITGVIEKRMNLFMSFSGGTSTDLFARDFRDALTDDDVSAIVLDVDSPGGSVNGPQEISDLIFRSRGVKPIIGVANESAFSAGYKILSAADEVVLPATGAVGSIGTRGVVLDQTERDAKQGLKFHVITSGEFKALGDPHMELTEAGRAVIQNEIDTFAGLFVDTVARNRGMSVEAVRELADGRIFIGQNAVDAGLADRLGTLDGVLGELRESLAPSPAVGRFVVA